MRFRDHTPRRSSLNLRDDTQDNTSRKDKYALTQSNFKYEMEERFGLHSPDGWDPAPIQNDVSEINTIGSDEYINSADLSFLSDENRRDLVRYAASRRLLRRSQIARDTYCTSRVSQVSSDQWDASLASRVSLGGEPILKPYEAIDFMAMSGMSSIECGRRTHLGDFAEGSIDEMTKTLHSTVKYFGGEVPADNNDMYELELLDIDARLKDALPFDEQEAVIVIRQRDAGTIQARDATGSITHDIKVRLRTSYLLPLDEFEKSAKLLLDEARANKKLDQHTHTAIKILVEGHNHNEIIPLSSTAYAYKSQRQNMESNGSVAENSEFETSEMVGDHIPYIRYDDMNAVGYSGPTPLDPDHIVTGGIPYASWKLASVGILADDIAANHKLSQRSHRQLLEEMQGESTMLIDRNRQVMKRIHESLAPSLQLQSDTTLSQCIERAKTGGATLEELIYILNRNPEIISLEVMNFIKPLDPSEIQKAKNLFSSQIESLTKRDSDSCVEIVPVEEQKTTEKIDADSGVRIQKKVVATAKTGSSHIEIVQKDVFMDMSFYGGAQVKNLPISTSAYVRVADYVDRKPYSNEPKMAHSLETLRTGSEGFDIDSMSHEQIVGLLTDIGTVVASSEEVQRVYNSLPPDARSEYVRGLRRGNTSTSSDEVLSAK